MPTINERCDRVHLINLLEEKGLCLRCNYCTFLRKLKNRLQELSFFTSNATFKHGMCNIKTTFNS